VDIRVFVIGGRVIGAIERKSPGWRTNLARGGKARLISLNDYQTALAIRSAAAVGAEYAGVDVVTGQDGKTYVLEVNGIPGWRGFQEATGLDVAGELLEYLSARAA
jgi:RimK family alpha-L-glutamate ligase